MDRTRLVGLAIGLLGSGSQLTQLGNAERSAGYLRLSAAAIVALLAVMLVTHLRGRSGWWTVPLVPALLALGGSGLQDPLSTMALAFGAAAVFSQYGGAVQWLTRLALMTAAIPVAVTISPNSVGRPVAWTDGVVLNLLPQLVLMAALSRGIHLALRRQERDTAREALLSKAGLAMIGVTDVRRIRELGRQTAEEIVALNPGVAMFIVRRDDEGLYVANLAGVPATLRGRRLPAGVEQLKTLLPGHKAWHVDALDDLFLVVTGRCTVPPEVQDAFRNLSHQVILAEKGCQAHAELEHSAHHDHLTQLPNRAKFLRAAAEAVATAPAGSVALLNVDLDDFKQVNDNHGHAAGDELLIEVAARLRLAGGLASRFGGDEFMLLLTDIAEPSEAAALAKHLSAQLAAPVTLTGGDTVTVGASIGVAVTEPGLTLAELSRRADIAMYSAKAQGKNQVDLYAPAAMRV